MTEYSIADNAILLHPLFIDNYKIIFRFLVTFLLLVELAMNANQNEYGTLHCVI